MLPFTRAKRLSFVALTLLMLAPTAQAQSQGQRSFQLESTVGLDSQSCAETASLSLPAGHHEVIVCLRAYNYERREFVLHDLLSETLGVLVTDLHYTMAPGESAFYTYALNVNESMGVTGAWIARGLNGEMACKIAWSVITVGSMGLTTDRNLALLCP